MRIFAVVFSILLFSAPSAHALKLSAVGAAVSSTPSETTFTHEPQMTLGAGVLLEMGMVPMVGLEIGALSLTRKSSRNIGGTEVVTEKELYQFPVLLRLNMGMLSFGFGGYYARYQGKIFEESTTGSNTVSAELSYSDKFATQHDYGLAGSLALAFPIGPIAKLLFDGRYTLGLRDNDTRETHVIKYNDYQILSGLQVGF